MQVEAALLTGFIRWRQPSRTSYEFDLLEAERGGAGRGPGIYGRGHHLGSPSKGAGRCRQEPREAVARGVTCLGVCEGERWRCYLCGRSRLCARVGLRLVALWGSAWDGPADGVRVPSVPRTGIVGLHGVARPPRRVWRYGW